MGKFDKQLKYSIRKVSIGAASVVIGAFYLAMGAGVVHAETNATTDGGASHSSPSPDQETSRPNSLTSSNYGAEPAQNPGGLQAGAVHSVKEETKTITRTIKYVDASDESKEVSATVTQTVTLTRKQGTEEWTTGKWEAKTAPTVDGYVVSGNNTVEAKEVTSSTESEEVLVYYSKKGTAPSTSSTSTTRGRRVRREVGDAPAGGTSNTSTGTETPAGSSTGNNETLNSALTERKGSTVQPNQPGVNIPKGDESGAHDPNAHISFDDPDHTATVEEMWKIIQHMPDDFQNNERTYLRNMDTLGRELRFDKTPENPEGVPLKPGEIRELHDFGGWHAIDKDGTQGKFVIGRKNEQGYFTGWRKVGETPEGIPIIEQGGMLGADALDNIYVHEQALDRRFDYMMMLVKGRTRANRNETVADKSKYDPRAQNERAEAAGANYNMLPFLEKDKFKKYSPGVVGYNGIEKKFTAFSTKYGSRVRVDFVTGYITDINGSKGSYRVVIKAQNSKGEETKVYDETISRVAEIVQNEELYKKGLNVESAHETILKFLKGEFEYRVNKIKNPKVKANSLLRGTKEKDYTPEQQKVYDQIVEEATEEAKKQGDIVMNVTEDFLSIAKSGKKDSEWKKTFTNTSRTTPGLSNDLNNLLKNADEDNPNTPTWLKSSASQAKADDRAYKLLNTLIPGAKKITYHVNDDQLEVETDKYTYTAARNGSKEVGIQGSDIAATLSADAYGANPQTFDRENTNTKANALNNGWARSSSEEFKHFSRFIGVDKGIVRTNVISDEELSAKIKEAVGPGYSKLGKAGYFSTADIPLGPDIVSYTVQVIPSDNERVGVNPQSSRIQYNMPILADFSVIQDTVEPSKEVARRIITKLKEKGKITGDEEKKIREEIDKSKKTSELRTAMSGDVKVKYQAVDGTLLTLKNTVTGQNETDLGKKDTDGTYIAQKDQLLGTDYDVTGKKLATLTTADGKRYRLKRSLADNSVEDGRLRDSASDTGTITTTGARTVTYVYEEYTAPPTGKGLVHFKKQVNDNTTEALNGYPDISLEGDVGTEFSSESVNAKITALKKAGYEIVSDTFTNGDKTIDSVTDTDGQDPSQVYNVTVREKVVTVTTPPTPNTPVDPTVPDGPKWPETGLAKSDLEKEVTRTITYVKKDTADGPEIADAKPTKKQTAHFKRSATYNLVTKVVTPGDWTSTDKTLEAVPTEKLDGYVANVPSVEEVETNVNSTNLDRKVVYTKLGSWIPKVPGVETPTPLPYPNHPIDPTKPGDPTDPNTPNVPVIPYVPGYTPKIGETPLQPKVPNDPTQGYIPPAVPTEPGTNTDITYAADPQKAVVKVFNTTTGTEVELPAEKVSIDNGTTDSAIPTTDLDTKIADLEKRGYVVENKDLLNNQKFDKEKDPTDGDPTQVFKLLVKERTVEVTEPKNPNDPVDPDKPEGPKWPETGLAKSDLEKEVTRTITYVKKDTADGPEIADAKPTKKQTAHFKRSATYNLVTKVVTPGDWTSTDKTLEAVPTEKLDGYVANVPSVEEVETNVNSTNLDRKVVYTKLGSWIPKVPGVETPTPLPYPNHPIDPTKPGDPTDPNTPNVPVIPYVPGYTPKIGETPLQPKVPNDPTQGYIPPAVPTEPGTNTDITYAADPQKAVVKVFNTTTGTEVELPAEKVSIDNGTTDSAIPTTDLDTKIADLEKRGYVVENKDLLNNQKFDKEKDPTDGDPTQVFKLLVKERTVEVTEPKNPNDPVDPDKPEGPKWPETGLAKSDLEKEVTRTITYVKKDTADGPEIADAKPTKKQTAHFKRSATYNLVTKVVTPGDWTSTDKTLEAVPTEKLDGYVANVPSVEEVETNVNSTNLDRKVVYTKLGSWVPKVPGVETPTPLPYPNNPTDPTKPGVPTDPTTPNVPVIPYVPGYTPKTPDGNPLVPVDPEHPENGYKVPPVPTEPGNDTPITYEKDPQKAIVKYVVEGTTKVLHTEELTGDSGTTINYTTANKLAELKVLGYELVTDGFTTATDKNFDKDKTVDQTFEVIVKPKVVDVPPFEPTNPKGDDNPKPEPGKPIDPENPNGPKWTQALIDKLETTKHVTRTITYVEDGTDKEVANKATDKVTFTRSLKVNVVTGDVVDPNVAWTSNDTTFDEVASPVVKGYVLKANQGSEDGLVSTDGKRVVASANLTEASENQNVKVLYTKLGSWVPTPPAGVTPPTGTNFDPKPYPNHPTDPTKPGEPEYPQPGTPVEPNTPKPPVIPYVPGYTPKTPNGNPLVPVDPEHPENGYKVPPVPTEPGNDTPITYEKDPQKAIVKYVVEGTTKVLHTEELTGDSGTTINYTTANKLAELKVLGYELVTDGFTTATDKNFDKDKTVDQTFEVIVKPKVVDVPPFEPTNPKGDDNPKPEPGKPIDPENPNGPKWNEELIKQVTTKKEVTRTINYVDEAGNKVSKPSTDKVTFTREAKINVVTGEITYGDWKAVGGDSTFDKVSSPVVKGYILKDPAQKEVAERKGITPTVENQTIEVVYKKLGSWIPKVPGVETPTPLPYPNHPIDPTKPGDPTDPNTPNVPVIPYVPGYTPKIGETPLQPKVPNDPTQGYIPPVPTEPGKDTPIEYVKVPNTPSPEEPVKPTPESNHITIWVDENGKPLKPEKPGTHEPGNIPGYRFITTTTKDGVTIHKFEKITPVEPNNPVPQKPTTPIPTPQDPTIPTPESQIPTPNTPEANTPTSETSRREELPNTGTEANANLAALGLLGALSGFGLLARKKKED